MKIVLLAEGATERAARERLKVFLDERRGDRPRVGLQIRTVDGGLRQRDVFGRCQEYLRDPQVCGVVALTDVYPAFLDAPSARTTVRGWMPNDPRCHSAAALHDFEAWLLCGWDAILARLGIQRAPFGANPETINGDNPPAHRLRDLFQTKRRRYIKPVDGKLLFDQLDLLNAATRCGELKRFLNTLLSCAGYDLLP